MVKEAEGNIEQPVNATHRKRPENMLPGRYSQLLEHTSLLSLSPMGWVLWV